MHRLDVVEPTTMLPPMESAGQNSAHRPAMQCGLTCAAGRKVAKPWVARESQWVGEIVEKVKTGDLLIFSSKHSTAGITRFFTSSKWDHIGIVVKPSANKAYIVEWGGGLFACELVERLTEFAEWDGMELVLRHLKVDKDRRVVEERIEQFIDMMFREKLGQNRGIPMSQVIKAARNQLWSKSTSYDPTKEVVVDDLNGLFCSKTVAVCYKAAGLLAPNRHADKFLPKHFSSSPH